MPKHERPQSAPGFRVKFNRNLVTSTRERPRTATAEVGQLFYAEHEIARFEDAAYMEEQRGLPPGSLEEDEAARLMQLQNMTVGGVGGGSGGGVEDNDGIETYEDFSDDSFDKGGFGSDDDF